MGDVPTKMTLDADIGQTRAEPGGGWCARDLRPAAFVPDDLAIGACRCDGNRDSPMRHRQTAILRGIGGSFMEDQAKGRCGLIVDIDISAFNTDALACVILIGA